MPFSINDAIHGYRWMGLHAAEASTGNGEGCQWNKHEKYTVTKEELHDLFGKSFPIPDYTGDYDEKKVIFGDNLGAAKYLITKDTICTEEKCYTSGVTSISYTKFSVMSDSTFNMKCASTFTSGNTIDENVFKLNENELSRREIIDINWKTAEKDIKTPECCSLKNFSSKCRNKVSYSNYIQEDLSDTCYFYRLISVTFNSFSGSIVLPVFKTQQVKFTCKICQDLILNIDEWCSLTERQFDNYQKQVMNDLKKLIKNNKPIRLETSVN
ncbi:hypothetical protein WA158_005038 [Blastocystis sp. Blastoise]